MPNSQLSAKLVEGIAEKELINIGADIGEVGLDKLLEEGYLKEIPVIGDMIKGYPGRTKSTT